MKKSNNLSAEERKWIHWVLTQLSKNGVGFIDLRKDQRIQKGKTFLIIYPGDLQTIPLHKGLIARANPNFRKRGEKK